MLPEPWRIELFGGLRAVQGDRELARFRTRHVASLLAYFAFYLDRAHPREQLMERMKESGAKRRL